jgi:hypothetical protein
MFYGGECGDGEPLLIYQYKLAGADHHHSIRHPGSSTAATEVSTNPMIKNNTNNSACKIARVYSVR